MTDFLNLPILNAVYLPIGKREFIAALAMRGLLANSRYFDSGIAAPGASCIAEDAVEMADALLAALEKQPDSANKPKG